jgi:type I site-specific restriction endonuclease
VNESETRAELIDPVLRAAGWGIVADSRVRRESICPGRIEGAVRRGKPEIADYVLTFRNHKLAVIEAKARDKGDTEGVGQAKAYAEKLQARIAFSTNGRRIYRIDMENGKEGYVERYRRRTNSGTRSSRKRTSGATVSTPCRSRSAAAPGRRAITSTTPSRMRLRRLPPTSRASC